MISFACGKFLKRWENQTTWLASWETCTQIKKQQLELDMEQHTGSKLGKEYLKAVYCHPDYLTYMQITSWEKLDWMKQKLESRLLLEISTTSGMQMIPPPGKKGLLVTPCQHVFPSLRGHQQQNNRSFLCWHLFSHPNDQFHWWKLAKAPHQESLANQRF